MLTHDARGWGVVSTRPFRRAKRRAGSNSACTALRRIPRHSSTRMIRTYYSISTASAGEWYYSRASRRKPFCLGDSSRLAVGLGALCMWACPASNRHATDVPAQMNRPPVVTASQPGRTSCQKLIGLKYPGDAGPKSRESYPADNDLYAGTTELAEDSIDG